MSDDAPAQKTHDTPRACCLLAKAKLGIETLPIDEMLRATVDSYVALGLLRMTSAARARIGATSPRPA